VHETLKSDLEAQPSVTLFKAMFVMNVLTPKAATKLELLPNKLHLKAIR
jgi:hypothetical protein